MPSCQMKPNICKGNTEFHNNEREKQMVQNWVGHRAHVYRPNAKPKIYIFYVYMFQ